jgi:competence protein ComEA
MATAPEATGDSPATTRETAKKSSLDADRTTLPQSSWRPVLLRVALGALALLGLSVVGALSMVTGVGGARASPSAITTPSAGLQPLSSAQALLPSAALPGASPPPTSGNGSGNNGSIANGSGNNGVGPTEGCPSILPDGRIVLNRAGLDELRKIPGVGPKRGAAILALRDKLKRFRRPTDLLRVRGIGAKSLSRMQPLFVVDDPPGSPCSATGAKTADTAPGTKNAAAKATDTTTADRAATKPVNATQPVAAPSGP